MGYGRNQVAELEATLDNKNQEIERLLDLVEGSQKDIDEKDTEIERLRAALRDIADLSSDWATGGRRGK